MRLTCRLYGINKNNSLENHQYFQINKELQLLNEYPLKNIINTREIL